MVYVMRHQYGFSFGNLEEFLADHDASFSFQYLDHSIARGLMRADLFVFIKGKEG